MILLDYIIFCLFYSCIAFTLDIISYKEIPSKDYLLGFVFAGVSAITVKLLDGYGGFAIGVGIMITVSWAATYYKLSERR